MLLTMRLIAVGDAPVGFVAIGGLPTGVIAIGFGATGVVAVGQLARGVVAIGQLAFGVIAIGQLAIGVGWCLCQGGIAATAGPAQEMLGIFGRLHVSRLFMPDSGRILTYKSMPVWRVVFGSLTVAVLAAVWWFGAGLPLHEAFTASPEQ